MLFSLWNMTGWWFGTFFLIYVWHLPSSTLAEVYGLWMFMVYITIANWWFGTMEFYDFPYIGNVIIPTDELIFFRGVGQPPTRWGCPVLLQSLDVLSNHTHSFARTSEFIRCLSLSWMTGNSTENNLYIYIYLLVQKMVSCRILQPAQ